MNSLIATNRFEKDEQQKNLHHCWLGLAWTWNSPKICLNCSKYSKNWKRIVNTSLTSIHLIYVANNRCIFPKITMLHKCWIIKCEMCLFGRHFTIEFWMCWPKHFDRIVDISVGTLALVALKLKNYLPCDCKHLFSIEKRKVYMQRQQIKCQLSSDFHLNLRVSIESISRWEMSAEKKQTMVEIGLNGNVWFGFDPATSNAIYNSSKLKNVTKW